jgi:hypothetical protein
MHRNAHSADSPRNVAQAPTCTFDHELWKPRLFCGALRNKHDFICDFGGTKESSRARYSGRSHYRNLVATKPTARRHRRLDLVTSLFFRLLAVTHSRFCGPCCHVQPPTARSSRLLAFFLVLSGLFPGIVAAGQRPALFDRIGIWPSNPDRFHVAFVTEGTDDDEGLYQPPGATFYYPKSEGISSTSLTLSTEDLCTAERTKKTCRGFIRLADGGAISLGTPIGDRRINGLGYETSYLVRIPGISFPGIDQFAAFISTDTNGGPGGAVHVHIFARKEATLISLEAPTGIVCNGEEKDGESTTLFLRRNCTPTPAELKEASKVGNWLVRLFFPAQFPVGHNETDDNPVSLPAFVQLAVGDFHLRDAKSTNANLHRALRTYDRGRETGVDGEDLSIVDRLCSKDKEEVIGLERNYSFSEDGVDSVVVRRRTKNDYDCNGFLPAEHLFTDQRIHLGMNLEEVESRLGRASTRERENQTILEYQFEYGDAGGDAFWDRYVGPLYRAVYTFEDGQLIQFQFGFPGR